MPDKGLISAGILFSLLCFVSGFVSLIWGAVRKAEFYRKSPDGYFSKTMSFSKRLLILSVATLMAVWSLRFTISYYSMFYEVVERPYEDIGNLGLFEEFTNSFLHTLQTFSLDEDYTGYWLNGQAMIGYIFGGSEAAAAVYNLYNALLNVVAPVAGGAIVFEMLTKIFPKLRLFFSNMNIWKEKYYFSELNENSLALARSILSDPSRRKCNLIFTDVYSDEDEEESTEWLLEAKSMGAICLKDDLIHINLNKKNKKNKYIFLMDREEDNNVGTLTKLISDDRIETHLNTQIYVFSTDRKYSRIEDKISEIVRIRNEKLKSINNLYIIPINIVRNTADTLMQDLPLFEPLIGSKKKKLTVTILGGGSVGTEMFLAAYRFGQILDVELHINVVSIENEETEGDEIGFNDKINFINPEILRSADPDDELLRYSKDDPSKKSAPYMHYRYIRANVLSHQFTEMLENDADLLDTDYFILTLGNDEDNLTVADKLKRIIGKHHIMKNHEGKTVIAYNIYNPDLSSVLNERKQRYYVKGGTGDADIYMYAYGCTDEVYSCDNVFFDGIRYSAYLINEKYNNMSPQEIRNKKEESSNGQRSEIINNIYNYMSSMAKGMHIKYKIYSAGYYDSQSSVFSKNYTDKDKDRLKAYKNDIIKNEKQDFAMLHKLAWLEHRRWNAFMRTCGFRYVSIEEMKQYYNVQNDEHNAKDHKYISLKLHPCLVECSPDGILELDASGKVKKEKQFDQNEEFDYLDIVSYAIYKENPKEANNFKIYDYPAEEDLFIKDEDEEQNLR